MEIKYRTGINVIEYSKCNQLNVSLTAIPLMWRGRRKRTSVFVGHPIPTILNVMAGVETRTQVRSGGECLEGKWVAAA